METMVPTRSRRHVAVGVTSAGDAVGNAAGITVDGRLVPVPPDYGRGYNVVALDPLTGDMQTATFDILGWGATNFALAAFLTALPTGYLVAVAVKDDGQMNLMESTIAAFEALGARQIRQLAFRDSWAFATIVGRPDVLLAEQRSGTSSVHLDLSVELRCPTPFVGPFPPDIHRVSIISSVRPSHIEMWLDGALILADTGASAGLHVATVDPATWTVTDQRSFDPSEQPGERFAAHVATIPAGAIVLVGTRGLANLNGPGFQALAHLGGWRFEFNTGSDGYALVGRAGAVPGSMYDTSFAPSVMLGANLGPNGEWAPHPMALLTAGPGFGSDASTVLQGGPEASLDLTSWNPAILPGPGTGVTARWMPTPPAAPDPDAPGLVLWGPAPDLDIGTGQGAGATMVALWPIEGRSVPSRSVLRRRDGTYLGIGATTQSPVVAVSQLRQSDFLRVTPGDPVGAGRRCDIDGVVVQPGSAERLRMVLRTTADNTGIEFVPDSTGTERSHLVLVDAGEDRSSLMPDDGSIRWVGADGRFTAVAADREIFTRPSRFADVGIPGAPTLPGEGVGPLAPGEIALHTGPSFRGDAWVITEDIADIRSTVVATSSSGANQPLAVGSIRLGPHTALRCFTAVNFGGTPSDVSTDAQLTAEQWSEVASLRIVRLARPGSHPMQVAVELGDDYRHASDGSLQAYEAYRTTLSLPPNVSMVEVRATASVTIDIGADHHDIGPDQPAVVVANGVKTLVVTTDATALGTAGLSFRTDTMHPGESFPVFPDRAIHERLATRKDATSDDGFTAQTGIGLDGQRALGHVMATIVYSGLETVIGTAHARAIAGAAMDQPGWRLDVPEPGKRSEPAFQHLDEAAIAAAISGATDGDDPTRSVGALWSDFVAGAHELESIIVHKVTDDAHTVAHELHTVLSYVEAGVSKVVSFALHTAQRAIELGHMIIARIGGAVGKVVTAVKMAFDWPAILHTQQVIVDTLTRALDELPARITQLSHSVDRFFGGVKATVASAIDTQIGAYRAANASAGTIVASGATTDHAEARQAANEKAHWLLAKVADHHAGSDLPGPTPPRSPASFLAMMTALRERVNDPAVTSALASASTFVTAAFAHPGEAPTFLMDGLLEAVKAVVLAALDVLDGVSIAVLAALEDALVAFRQALTAPLDVPLVADLYRWAVTTHGTSRPEDTFSVINMVGLLGAIPATVLSRLVSGVSPFAPAASTRDEAAPEPEADPDFAVKRDWGVVAGSLSLASAILKAGLDIQIVTAPTGLGNAHVNYGAGEMVKLGGKWVMLPKGLDLRPPRPPRLSTTLEISSLIIDVIAHMSSWPGGIPFGAFDVSLPQRDAAPADYFDSVGWTFDACAFSVDVITLAVAGSRTGRAGGARADAVEAFLASFGPIVASLLSLASFGLAITTAVEEGEHKGADYKSKVMPAKTAQAVLSAVPGLASMLRFPTVVGATEGLSLVVLSAADLLFGLPAGAVYIAMAEQGLIDPANIQ